MPDLRERMNVSNLTWHERDMTWTWQDIERDMIWTWHGTFYTLHVMEWSLFMNADVRAFDPQVCNRC